MEIEFYKIQYKDITYPRVKENLYAVSNHGYVMNKETGNILKPFYDKDSYQKIGLKIGDESYKNFLVHRLVAWEFCEDRDIVKVVNHIDGAKIKNNEYLNLEWCTRSENDLHAFRLGLRKPTNSKYSEDDIHRFCKYFQEGKIVSDVMTMEGSDRHNNPSLYKLLNDLKKRKSWSHITRLYEYDSRNRPFREDLIQEVKDMFNKDMTAIDIFKSFGYTKTVEDRKLYTMIKDIERRMK